MNQTYIVPSLAKTSLMIIAFAALFGILFVAKGIIVPFVFSTLAAIALSPIVDYFVNHGVKRTFAIIVTLFIAISVMASIIILVLIQIIEFGESLPVLIDKTQQMLDKIVLWAADYFHLSVRKINVIVNENSKELMEANGSLIGSTLVNTGTTIFAMLLVPVYVFMILFYQSHLKEFIRKLFASSSGSQISEVFTNTKQIVQSYLGGLMIEAFLVAAMQSTSLFIIGIDYAILFGLIGALLNMIPYIGSVVAVLFPVLVSLTTKPPIYAVFILIAYLIVQLIDNNFILPKIVGSKVKLNALIALLAVFVGNILWGIPGMFLAIPLTAIIKVICDHVEALKPFGFLLGNTVSGKKEPLVKKGTENAKQTQHR